LGEIMERPTFQVSDVALWRRLLLVALTGAVPLFIVALTLIKTAYTELIEFGEQEQRGNELQLPLERLLDLLPRYQAAAHAALIHGGAPSVQSQDLARQIDRAFAILGDGYRGNLGRALKLDDELSERGPDVAHYYTVTLQQWASLRQAPLARSASGQAVTQLVAAVRSMIRRLGDHSNLILDDDLDSYYLTDITLSALPEMQERLGNVSLQNSEWLRTGLGESKRVELAVTAAILERYLARVTRAAHTSLAEDARFYGVSPSLHANLPPAVEAFSAAVEPVLRLLQRAGAGDAVDPAELERLAWQAHGESFRLWQATSTELDGLLQRRLDAIGKKRSLRFAIIFATLALAALAMALVIRSLLAARYAELRRNQEELSSKEAQLRALGDNLPNGMTYQFVSDANGEMSFAYVSAGVERLHGLPASAVLANAASLLDQFVPEDVPPMRTAMLESMADGTPINVTCRVKRTDGTLRWMQFSSAPRRQLDGQWVWDGIETDVTERHEAENALKQTAARFTHIFKHSPIPISLNRRADGKFIDANESFLNVSGFGLADVVEHTPMDLGIYPDPAKREEVLQLLHAHGHVHGYEVPFRTKSGGLRQMMLWIEPIQLSAEECLLVLAIDVTRQREAEGQQRQLEEQLRQAQKLEALGTLAGGIAHDFNNILSGIVSLSEVSMLDNPGNQGLQDNLGEVLKAGHRAANLIRQILSFSRQDAQERLSQQLGPVVDEALTLLRATLPTSIEIVRQVEDGLPNVMANSTQIHQVIMNLGTNAAHAMKARKGQLRVRLEQTQIADAAASQHAELAIGEYVRLSVEDTGTGMDHATLRRVFEPFFTTKPAGEGTGLGLSVVHGIVKEHGGAITVHSEVGVGTTLAIYLPALPSSIPPHAVLAQPLAQGAGQKVLFVDDEASLRGVAVKMLSRLGYEPVVFETSEQVLAAFKAEPTGYDALISDLAMPGLSGLELATQILRIRPGFPIVLASGFGGKLTRAEARKLGIRDLISKPLDFRTLADALEQALAPDDSSPASEH